MKIIIVGCGKVGSALTEQLVQEGHDITVIDTKASAIHHVTNNLDVMSVVGNGASYHVQMEAGIQDANLLIAVTSSDELNMLCCLIAKKAGNVQTIARVRNPEYNNEIRYIKEELGLSMSINPELAAAMEMARLIRLPSAIKIDSFAKGKVDLLKVKIPHGSMLHNLSIKQMSARLSYKVLICAVERHDEVVIPDGNFILQEDDKISLIALPKHAIKFFKQIGITANPIKDVILVGGSTIALYLAQQLALSDIHVKILEQNKQRCVELSELLPNAEIYHCDATEQQVLIEEGIESVDAFASLTNLDEENILLSMFASKKNSHAKVITKVTRSTFEDVIKDLPLGSTINPKLITAYGIVQYVRAMQNSLGSSVETLYKIVGNKAEALEFSVSAKSDVVGVPLEKLKLHPNILVCCINHKGKIIIPSGKDVIHVGDTVIVVTTNPGLDELSDILKVGH